MNYQIWYSRLMTGIAFICSFKSFVEMPNFLFRAREEEEDEEEEEEAEEEERDTVYIHSTRT